MPTRRFICEHCGWPTTQFAARVGHPCPKNKGETLTELVCLDDPGVSPVDICCDGCDAERLGEEHHVYSDRMAKASATAAGWSCQKKSDFCPRCVAERKVA